MDLVERYWQSSYAPWKGFWGMVRVSPHSWYVGDEWVGVILIETGDGLVMIDSGIRGQIWLIFESVRKLGYDPEKDIRLCLLSHAHCDHCSAMALLQLYAKPVVYMSECEKDWPGKPECYAGLPEDLDPVEPFAADRFYEYGTAISHGGISILPVHTPGHTVGTTSFFYDDMDDDGRIYRVGMHGGLGLNTLADDCFTSWEAAHNARSVYRSSVEKVIDFAVDITVSNHGSNMDLVSRTGECREDFRAFVDTDFWRRHLQRKLEQLSDLERSSKY